MYFLLIVAIILRFTLATNKDFVYARYAYTVDLVIFCLRILQLYYFHKRLGPKVILIGRMVCVIIDQDEMQDGISSRLTLPQTCVTISIGLYFVLDNSSSRTISTLDRSVSSPEFVVFSENKTNRCRWQV